MKKFLLIDDDPEWARLLASRLSDRGVRIQDYLTDATGVSRIRETLTRGIYDGAIVDIRLSKRVFDSSGLVAVEELKEIEPRLPIAVVTQFADDYAWVREKLQHYDFLRIYDKRTFLTELDDALGAIALRRVPELGAPSTAAGIPARQRERSQRAGTILRAVYSLAFALLVAWLVFLFGWN